MTPHLFPFSCLKRPALAWLLLVALAAATSALTRAAPALQVFKTITTDATGQKLQSSFIWTNPALIQNGIAVAFRKTFDLPRKPAQATLHLFADARYILWVNGTYVERGPSRFQPNGPEYDSVDISARLVAGKNTLALLVVGNLSGGKVMRHAPGFAALLEADDRELLRTDTAWKWTDRTRFRQVEASWPNLGDTIVDSRVEDGDWTQGDYADNAWQSTAKISGDSWGALVQRRTAMLRETTVPVKFNDNATLPVTLQTGQSLVFDTGRIVQAYPVIEFDSAADTEIAMPQFGLKYFARAGRQSHFTIDSRGLSHGVITVKSGRVTITGFRLVERLYPFDIVGSFKSNDEYLNKLWALCARSCQVLSEDSYVDCADRERVEWMDDDPPAFDITRTAMAGPGTDGKPVYSDPRLLGEMVRRTALTLQPDGWVKAHTCSDRYDIHAKMEDRACDWVEGIRTYYEATGDTKGLQEIWPAIVAQMDYFLQRRTARGLVRARDWVIWGNPVGYCVGEGTTLNVFVQRALSDASFLGGIIGEKADSARFAQAAVDLSEAINTVLWDEAGGGYYSGYFSDADVAENTANKRKLPFPLTNNLTPSNVWANVFALDRGIVPAARRARVLDATLKQEPKANGRIMLYYYVAKQRYALDQPEQDQWVLDLFRQKWAAMVKAPWQCSWEEFSGGSKAHIYGMYPGYFLSANVLGVRRDAPVSDKTIVIEPHLGDLTQASGVVVTEFGPVPVSWQLESGRLRFTFVVPSGTTAILRLPARPGDNTVTVNKKTVTKTAQGSRLEFRLPAGPYEGVLIN